MTPEANKLCTLDNNPQPEGLSSGLWPSSFSILILLNSMFINICTMREIAQFKPIQFLHLMLMRVAIFSKWEHALTFPWCMCPKQLVYYLEMILESESHIFHTELCFIFDVCIYDNVFGGNIISASSGESWWQKVNIAESQLCWCLRLLRNTHNAGDIDSMSGSKIFWRRKWLPL